MTKVIFETAALADAIKKADRIAPSRGQAFDKANGIVMAVDPESGIVVVKATDLHIYSMEWLIATIEGEPTEWRVPSRQFAAMIASLPIGTGKTIELEEKITGRIRMLHLTSGNTRAKFNLQMMDYYPRWEAFDPDGLEEVNDLGGRIKMAEWAASRTEEPPLNGILLDGKEVVGCDRYRLATVSLPIPHLEAPIVVPAGMLGSVLNSTGEVHIGVRDGYLLLMPDDTTQIRTTVFDVEYPPIERLKKRDHPEHLKVRKAPLLDILQRASTFAGNDRFPILRLFFGAEEVAAMMETREIGVLADTISVPGYCTHKRMEVKFTPKNIIDAIEAVPNEELMLGYDPENSMAFIHIDGGSGYEAWAIPRKGLTAEERAAVDGEARS